MSFTDEYLEQKKKKKKGEQKKTGHAFTDEYLSKVEPKKEEDIAPVRTTTTQTTTNKKEDEERTYFTSGALKDGVTVGSIAKSIIGSDADILENIGIGARKMAENAIDAGLHAASAVGRVIGADDFSDNVEKVIAQDILGTSKKSIVPTALIPAQLRPMFDAAKGIKALNTAINGEDVDDASLLGERTDSLIQTATRVMLTRGLSGAGVPWQATTGVTSYGGEVESALNEGATTGEAATSAAITAGGEILGEYLLGGMVGETGLDDALIKSFSRNISNKTFRSLLKFGIKAGGEGLIEEPFSWAIGRIGQKLTYADEKTWKELFASEEAVDELVESVVGGLFVGGVFQGADAVQSKQAGVDYATGLTTNEEKVVTKEYESRLAEKEQDGKKLTSKEKNKLYDEVVSDMEKGRISIDTIEEVLGGETYQNYQNAVKNEDSLRETFNQLNQMKQGEMTGEQIDLRNELKEHLKELESQGQRNVLKNQLDSEVMGLAQNTRLAESYNERYRKGQAFEADVTKYDEKQKAVIQKAIDSGILNNTNRTHEFVDMIAKISADKGVLFDFTDNERLKESGFAMDEGVTRNGFVSKDGVTLNMDSAKSLNAVVGHEITHVLEGTELYTALQSAVTEYAKTKGEYDSRLEAITKLYKKYDPDADPTKELTADLVGDYLFTDADFINHLSTNNRNVFQKIYDEIKYLCKVATAGSKEAKQLLEVKRAFEKAYKSEGKPDGDTKYSVTEHTTEEKAAHNKTVLDHFGKTYSWAETGYVLLDGTKLDLSGKHEGAPGGYRTVDHRDIVDALGSDYGDGSYSGSLVQFMSEGNIRISPESNGINLSVKPTKAQERALSDFISRARGEVLLDIDGLDGYTEVSVEYPRGTHANKVLSDIREWFDNGKKPEVPNTSPFRYSLSSETDKAYMDAVNRGDDLTVQRMVNETAKESGVIMNNNGRRPLSLYRGTPNFGRTVFKSPVIFTSTSPSVSAGYGGNKGYARKRLISESYTPDDGSTETLIKNAKNVLDWNLMPYDDAYRSEIRENTRAQSDEMSQKVNDVWTVEAVDSLPDMTEELDNSIAWVMSLPGAINENVDDFGNNEYFPISELENWIDKFDEHLPKLREYFDQHRSELKDTAAYPMFKLVMGYELSDFAIDARYKFLQSFGGYDGDILVTETGNLVSAETVREQVESAKDIGSYHLYGYAGDNPLVIDGNGAMWFGVPVEQWGGNFTTDDIVKRAQEEGYTSVCIKNINDVAMNNYSANVKSDIYAFFDREQVKSADAVTYDDNGNVIPLSERFNTKKQDIRYSLSNEGEQIAPVGNYNVFGKDIALTQEEAQVESEENLTSAPVSEVENATIEHSVSDLADIAKQGRRENMRGAYTHNGKQYLSDGSFIAEFNTVDESLEQSNDFPIKQAVKELDESFARQVEGKYDLHTSDTKGFIKVGNSLFGSKRVNALIRAFENPVFSLANIRGGHEALVVTADNGRAVLMPVRASGNAYLVYEAQPIAETANFPDDLAPIQSELERLQAELTELDSRLMADPDNAELENQWWETQDRINALEKEISAEESSRMDSLTEADIPPEMDTPITEDAPFEGGQVVESEDPFADREVPYGNEGKKVHAYMYDNPEVKPFFQAEAIALLEELNSGTKGEKWYNDKLFYESGGEEGFGGVKRHQSESIDRLSYEFNLSYEDIEKGLNAIIEDNGAENIAAAKKIEFVINDRLMYGYKPFGAMLDPDAGKPNQDYIALIQDKQRVDSLTDADAPPVFDAPIGDTARDTAPTYGGGQQTMFEPPVKETAPVKETVQKVAQIRKAEPQKEGLRDRTKRRFNDVISMLGDKGWVFENIGKKTGNREVEAKYDFMKNRVKGQAQEYVREHLLPIYEKIQATGKEEDFYHYAYHLHNIDRMSLETEAERTRREEIRKQLDGYTEKQIQSIASETITRNTPQDRVKQIYLAQEYIDLGGANGKNKPVYGSSVTADVSRKKVAEYEAKNPEFKELEQDVLDFNKGLRDFAVRQGLITQKVADRWAKMYPHYVPIRRTDRQGKSVSVPLDSNRTGVNNPFKRAKGGNSDFIPLMDAMAMNTEQIFYAVARNDFGTELMGALETSAAMDAEKSVDAESRQAINAGGLEPGTRVKAHDRENIGTVKSFNPKTGKYKVFFENQQGHSATVDLAGNILSPLYTRQTKGKDVDTSELLESTEANDNGVLVPGMNGQPPQFTVFVKGKPVTFDITEEMYKAMKPAEGILNETYGIPNKIASGYKKILTEYDPFFALFRNPVKDTKDVLFNSQHAAATYAAAPKTMKQIATKGNYYTEFIRNGGKSNTYYDTKEMDFTDAANKRTNPYSKAAENFEMFWRLSEYIASREAGRSEKVAMLDAARVTTNFGAGGDFTKWLNRNGALFLNPSVQGVMQIGRNVREAYQGGLKSSAILAAKVLSVGLGGMFFNWLLWDDDEEYEELSDYVKQNYFVIWKTEDGKFIRIPKGRMEAVIQNGFEQMQHLVTGDGEADLGTFADLVANNLAPNNPLKNNLFSPIQQALTNTAWYGGDIVPTRLQDVPAAEQYDESTDSISKFVGETFDISPYKVNYAIGQYGGGFADVVLPMFAPEAEGDSLLAPIKDEFMSDSTMKNQNVSDFYDKVDELTVNANSSKATDEDILMSKYMSAKNSDLSALYKQKRDVQNSDLTDAEKYEEVRAIQQQINDLAKESLNSYENVTIEGVYAKVGDVQFRWYEPGEDSTAEPGWKKLTDEQLEKQNEVTSGLGISPSDYWSNKDEYDFEYTYPEKYEFFRENGISYETYKNADEDGKRAYTWAYENPGKYTMSKAISDDFMEYYDIRSEMNDFDAKDANGESVSGLKKERVMAYIEGLDLDYGQKLILHRSMYESKEDKRLYNRAIVEYLDSREDISWDEMKAILVELDFEVSDDGTISW